MAMMARVAYADIPAGRRIVAVSDIHGQLDYLRALLDKVRFGPEDVLVIVGDTLEKGPKSLETLRFIMALGRTHTVHHLIGNVDEWALDKVFSLDAKSLMEDMAHITASFGGSFVGDLCREMGVTLTGDMDRDAFRAQLRETFAQEYAYMRGLPTVLETDQARFVHGGVPNAPLASLEGRPAHDFTKWDAFMEEGLCFEKYVVVGHWPVCLYSQGRTQYSPVINTAQRIIAIDGGCGLKKEGQLNALLLQNGGIAWDSYDSLPVRTALDAQQASDTCHAITFMNGNLTLLERKEDMALVSHEPSGYQMWVPVSRLLKRDGHIRCNDVTDHRLGVAPGDTLTVIEETSMGTYCRKDGIAGWYMGGLREQGADAGCAS